MIEEVKIELSRTKLFLRFCLSLLFPLLCFIQWKNGDYDNIVAKIVSIAILIFFTLIIGYLLFKMFDPKEGLRISKEGIFDNSNWTSVGLIPWDSITHFEKHRIKRTNILIVHTTKSKSFIEQTNWLKRRLLTLNAISYDSPISIISGSLKCSFSELEKLVTENFIKYKNQSQK